MVVLRGRDVLPVLSTIMSAPSPGLVAWASGATGMMMGFHMYENSFLSTISHLFWAISHLFSNLKIFNLDHKNRLIKYYKNIYGLRGFSYENSFISTISHLFRTFSHL